MARGDIRRIKRVFPHHVALPNEVLHSSVNGAAVFGLAKTLFGALPPYHLDRDGREMVVFCFSRQQAAQTFAERFGGEILTVQGGATSE